MQNLLYILIILMLFSNSKYRIMLQIKTFIPKTIKKAMDMKKQNQLRIYVF